MKKLVKLLFTIGTTLILGVGLFAIFGCAANGNETGEAIAHTNGQKAASVVAVAYSDAPDSKAVFFPDDPVKEGHTFIGWYYDEALTVPYNGEPIQADTNLYAKFEVNSYTVTFNSNGGNDVEVITTEWNSTISPKAPTRTGYSFSGWYFADGTKYENQPIKEDTTLIAQWQIKKLTVTFYVNGTIYTTKEVEYGTVFAEVVDELRVENLQCISVLDGGVEKDISEYLNCPITDDFSVKASKIASDAPASALLFIKDYPWIFLACGAGLSLIVALVGVGKARAYIRAY